MRSKLPRLLLATALAAAVSFAYVPAAGTRAATIKCGASRVAPAVKRLPRSIASDGSRDVTEKLTSFINRAPRGSRLVFAPNGRYRINGSVMMLNRRCLWLDGNGATLVARTSGDRDRRHLWFKGGGDVRMSNLVIRGANPNGGVQDDAYRDDRAFQHGIAIHGVHGMVVSNVDIYDVYGDFVYVSSRRIATPPVRSSFVLSRDITITGSTFARNGRQGVAVVGAEGVTIKNNSISQVRRTLIDLETHPTTPVTNVDVVGNRFGPRRLNFVSAAGQGPVHEVRLASNLFRWGSLGSDFRAPTGKRSSNIVYEDNVSNSPAQGSGPMINFIRTDHISVIGNKLTFAPSKRTVFVGLSDSCHARIGGNSLVGAGAVLKVGALVCDHRTWNNLL